MANELAGFDAANFRKQIRATMVMGLPETVAERPTFYFRPVTVYAPGVLLDTEGSPLDPRIAATAATTAADSIQVACAVAFTPDSTNQEGIVGTFWSTRAVLTLLDEDYALVKDAIEVSLGGKRYNVSFAEPPVGLGPVTVYQLHCFPKGSSDSAGVNL